MLFFLLTFIPVFLANENPNLIDRYENGLSHVDREMLLESVVEDFAIYDCNGLKFKGLDLLISEVGKFPFPIKTKPYKILKQTENRFEVEINDGEMMVEFDYLKKGNEIYLLSEMQKKCPNSTYPWYSSALIDYDAVIYDTIVYLLSNYRYESNYYRHDELQSSPRFNVENVLNETFFIDKCGVRQIDFEGFRRQLAFFSYNVATNEIDYDKIQKITADENGVIKFNYDGKVDFVAKYIEKDKKYKLIREYQRDCSAYSKVSSFLINDKETMRNFAKEVFENVFKGIKRGDVTDVIYNHIKIFECGDEKGKIISKKQFVSLYVNAPYEYNKDLEFFDEKQSLANKKLNFKYIMKKAIPNKISRFNFELDWHFDGIKLDIYECDADKWHNYF